MVRHESRYRKEPYARFVKMRAYLLAQQSLRHEQFTIFQREPKVGNDALLELATVRTAQRC